MINIQRLEKIKFCIEDEDFKMKLLKGGVKTKSSPVTKEEGNSEEKVEDKHIHYIQIGLNFCTFSSIERCIL